MTTHRINPVTEIFHFDHDDWCVMEQQTNEDPMQIVINAKDIPKVVDALNAALAAYTGN